MEKHKIKYHFCKSKFYKYGHQMMAILEIPGAEHIDGYTIVSNIKHVSMIVS